MRKFFAAAMAAAMVMSMSAVSFAANAEFDTDSDIVLSKFFKYSADTDKVSDTQAEYGKSYYAMIFEGKWSQTDTDTDGEVDAGDKQKITYAPITKYDQVEKMKIKAEFEMGEDLVESVSIVKKPFKTFTAINMVLLP